jgi:hypothetical protein
MPACERSSPDLGQLLQNLGQQLRRNSVGVGHILGAERSRLRVLGQVLERHQSVIRFFGQLEHEYPTSSVRIQYTTVSVGISSPSLKFFLPTRRPKKSCKMNRKIQQISVSIWENADTIWRKE